MKELITILFTLYFLSSFAQGQSKCYIIDSIVVKYFPLNMKTPISVELTDFDKDEPLLETKTIIKDSIIKEFLMIQLEDTNRLFNDYINDNWDYRIKFELYSSKLKIEELVLDKKKWYIYLGNTYTPSYQLMKWYEVFILNKTM